MTMLIERKQDLSVYYYIKDLFSGTPQINIVDEFPEELLTLPTVSVEAKTVEPYNIQLGSKTRVKLRVWYIDVFAQTKSQRDDIGYTILNALEECIPVYDYDSGFPPTVVPQDGCMDVDSIRMEIIRVDSRLVSKLYYRAEISFSAIYNQL